jgi:hypothetical protein
MSNPLRARLQAFLARYVPEHLAEVEALATEYRGREAELLDALAVRFGPEPDPTAFRTRVERLFAHYDPGRVPEAAKLALRSAGKEDFVLRTLSRKYGPEPELQYALPPMAATAPHPPTDPHRVRLTRWLMLRLPQRVPEVDALLCRFDRREAVLFRLLAQTLGPEPPDDNPRENLRSAHLPTTALRAYFAQRRVPPFLRWIWAGDTQDGGAVERGITRYDVRHAQLKQRLEAFYQYYSPIKIAEVEETLRRWRGREDILFEALVHKYGPEPLSSGAGVSAGGTGGDNGAGGPAVGPGGAAGAQPGVTPRTALRSFYAVHNPNRLPDIDRLLERFSGREATLFNMLQAKYGDASGVSSGGGALGASAGGGGGGLFGGASSVAGGRGFSAGASVGGGGFDDATFGSRAPSAVPAGAERVLRKPPLLASLHSSSRGPSPAPSHMGGAAYGRGASPAATRPLARPGQLPWGGSGSGGGGSAGLDEDEAAYVNSLQAPHPEHARRAAWDTALYSDAGAL